MEKLKEDLRKKTRLFTISEKSSREIIITYIARLIAVDKKLKGAI